MSNSSGKKSNSFRIIAIILLIIGGSFFAFMLVIRLNPSLYRKMFLHASSSTPADLDPSPASTQPIISTEGGNDDYRSFMLDVTAAVISESGSDLNTSVINPEKYGINSSKVTEYFIMNDSEKEKLWNDYRQKLEGFDYNSLSSSQQRSYDSIKFYLDNKKSMEPYGLFSSDVVGDISGPYAVTTVFTEYPINSEVDAAEYVSLLRNMDSYFKKIEDAEKKRSEAGFFMPDNQADKSIDQLSKIRENIAAGSFKDSFLERLNKTDLNGAVKDEYIKEHDKAINEVILPGYDSLIKTLESLKGTSKYSGGLCNYPNGKEYFASLIETYVGAGKESPDAYFNLIDSYLESFYKKTDELTAQDRNLTRQIDGFSLEKGTTEELVNDLKEKYKNDFTEIADFPYDITPVEENLSEDTREAFYSSPALDAGFGGTLYINEKKAAEDDNYYETVAHESFPGHMYQTMYMANQVNSGKEDVVRYFLTPKGYIEGWGIYSGFYAFDYTDDYSRNLADLVKAFEEGYICLLGRADFMVNYYGMPFNEVNNFFAGYGYATESVQEVYDFVVESPGEYAMYCLGFLEVKEMQRKAIDLKGESYTDKSFNDFMIRTGPMAFSDIEKRIYTIE